MQMLGPRDMLCATMTQLLWWCHMETIRMELPSVQSIFFCVETAGTPRKWFRNPAFFEAKNRLFQDLPGSFPSFPRDVPSFSQFSPVFPQFFQVFPSFSKFFPVFPSFPQFFLSFPSFFPGRNNSPRSWLRSHSASATGSSWEARLGSAGWGAKCYYHCITHINK